MRLAAFARVGVMRGRDGGPDSDEALILRIAQFQDRLAFRRLFETFAPRIKSFLVRGGESAQQAEDLAQEAMLLVWRKAAQFDASKASASTWIFTIARNLRVDQLRRQRYPGFAPMDPGLMSDEPPVDAVLGLRQTEQQLRKAMLELPAEQLDLVMRSFFSDKPHSEIAAELGLPLGTVKSRIRLAVNRLKTLLGGPV